MDAAAYLRLLREAQQVQARSQTQQGVPGFMFAPGLGAASRMSAGPAPAAPKEENEVPDENVIEVRTGTLRPRSRRASEFRALLGSPRARRPYTRACMAHGRIGSTHGAATCRARRCALRTLRGRRGRSGASTQRAAV